MGINRSAASARQVTPLTVGQAGERDVLRRVLGRLSPAEAAVVGPGDDCAVLRVSGDLVVTSDTMIEGTDFRLDWHRGTELGWKLAATNLSDVAAMGATPTALTVAFACPRDTPVELLEEMSAGLEAACRELAPGCAVVGGDLATAPALFVAVTALGHLGGRRPVLRSGARPGDIVAYRGDLGLAGVGLQALLEASGGGLLSEAARAALWDAQPAAMTAHLRPVAPVAAGLQAQQAGATAMLDVSDALSLDAARIAEASGVCIDLSEAELMRGFGEQFGESVALEHMLTGGEDHGLLATFGPEATLPAGFVPIGRVCHERVSNSELTCASVTGPLTLDGVPLTPRGWDTFSGYE